MIADLRKFPPMPSCLTCLSSFPSNSGANVRTDFICLMALEIIALIVIFFAGFLLKTSLSILLSASYPNLLDFSYPH